MQNFTPLITWAFGICVTGFFVLLGFIIKLIRDMGDRVTFKWIEARQEKFEMEVKEALNELRDALTEIKDYLTGGLKQDGIKQAIESNKKDIAHIREKCELKQCVTSNTKNSEK